jgi:hypothetical protein
MMVIILIMGPQCIWGTVGGSGMGRTGKERILRGKEFGSTYTHIHTYTVQSNPPNTV